MGNQPWYASKEGRAEFGRRCAERDAQPAKPERDFILERYAVKPNVYEMCNRRADAITAKTREDVSQRGDWWRKADYWLGADEGNNPTYDEAVRWILMQCPDWKERSEIYLVKVDARWFGWDVYDVKRMDKEITDRHAEYEQPIHRARRKQNQSMPSYVYI